MSALTEAMLDSFDSTTWIIWSVEETGTAVASFTIDTTIVLVRFVEGGDDDTPGTSDPRARSDLRLGYPRWTPTARPRRRACSYRTRSAEVWSQLQILGIIL